jgi:hypothetical protein
LVHTKSPPHPVTWIGKIQIAEVTPREFPNP